MPATLKRNAVNLLALSIAFCFFFYASKHDPALNRNLSFAEDPYDAVGSFAIQFALLSGALSLVRAFRTYPDGTEMPLQRQLVAAGQVTGCMAVIVTLLVDLLALIRHPELWARSAISPLLLRIMTGLLGWAAISVAFGVRDAAISGARRNEFWLRSLPWFLGAMAIVAFYPERFRHTLFGAVATVVVGALVLFIPLRGVALATAPHEGVSVSGLASDLLSIVPPLRPRTLGDHGVRGLGASSAAARPSGLLTPGRLWIGICFCGVLIGCGLAGAELRESSSVHLRQRLLVVAVYTVWKRQRCSWALRCCADPCD